MGLLCLDLRVWVFCWGGGVHGRSLVVESDGVAGRIGVGLSCW